MDVSIRTVDVTKFCACIQCIIKVKCSLLTKVTLEYQ